VPTNYYEELMRIAETVLSAEDRVILRSAAFKLIPDPKPLYEKTTVVPNVGVHTLKVYE